MWQLHKHHGQNKQPYRYTVESKPKRLPRCHLQLLHEAGQEQFELMATKQAQLEITVLSLFAGNSERAI